MVLGERAGRTNLWPERSILVFTGTTGRFVATINFLRSISDDTFFFVARSPLCSDTAAHHQNNLTRNPTHLNKT